VTQAASNKAGCVQIMLWGRFWWAMQQQSSRTAKKMAKIDVGCLGELNLFKLGQVTTYYIACFAVAGN
jgi:hypothetical protein